LDGAGVVRADQPFRRAEAKYSLDSVGLRVRLNGGALSGVSLEVPGSPARSWYPWMASAMSLTVVEFGTFTKVGQVDS
jgi:hypothetical protein